MSMPPAFHDDDDSIQAPPPEEGPAAVSGRHPGPRFSRSITGTAALILVAGLAGFVWLQVSVPRLERIPHPERALTLMVGRMMDLEEAIARAPAWEQALYDLTSGGRAYELAQAIEWFDELVAAGGEPHVHLYLGILHAEAGHLGWVRNSTKEWQARREPFPTYARILFSAYLVPRLARTDEIALQAELAEALSENWFYDRLAINLANTAGDATLIGSAEEAMMTRGQPLLTRTRLLEGVESAVIIIGCAALVLWRQRETSTSNAGSVRVGEARLPPPWAGRVGIAVMLRGGALGVIVIGLLLLIGTDDPLLRLAVIPASNLPLIVLARTYLLLPAGLGVGKGLGLTTAPGSPWRIVGVMLAVLALGLIGEWAIDRAAVSFDRASHWTEWFDPDLVWGDAPMLVLSLVEYAILAPFFEEVVFRGLLFATLRRRFAWAPSALISAGIFAAAHGYGLLGFASVLWSGMIWAWAYEKTGSLLPGMAAHALNNLMVCLTLIALLRW